MRRSKAEIYLHFVWATYQRLPLVIEDIEGAVYCAIIAEANRLGAEVLAIGGMPDHVHLVVKKPPTIAESELMRRVKGVSSTYIREHLLAPDTLFRWQENYGVFSFHGRQVESVIAYVQRQKEHHEADRVRAEWEEAWIEVQPRHKPE